MKVLSSENKPIKKRNRILDFADIVDAIYSVNDDVFMKPNKWGYIANIKNEKILEEYNKFQDELKSKVLSDEERFYFDIMMIKKYRPQLAERIKRFEKEEGTYMIKIVTTDTGTGVTLGFDQGRVNDNGALEEWLVKAPARSSSDSPTKEWFTNGEHAFSRYQDAVASLIFHRIHVYMERQKQVLS